MIRTLVAVLLAAVSAAAAAQAPANPPVRIRGTVESLDGQVLTVKYKGGEKKILVTPKTAVVSYTPSDRSELKPGAPVFAVTQRQPDGTLSAARVNVGLHGQVPPM